jgi:hypothetical protein
MMRERGPRRAGGYLMFLHIGNGERIDNPTPEQIGHHLRNLPGNAPFLILNADDEHFIQATPAGDLFRVEWRQEAQQWSRSTARCSLSLLFDRGTSRP